MPAGETGSAAPDPNAQSGAGAPGTDPSGTGAPAGADTSQQTNLAPPKTAEQLQAELDAALRRMQAADQNNSKTQAELKKLQDAQLSEADKTKRDLEQAQAEQARLKEELKQTRIQNAFVTDNTYQWHDPRAALKLADLSSVEIKDDGTVTGLKDALKSVADANPWMLKPKEGGPAAGDAAAAKGSATGVGGAGGNTASGADKAGLEKKFPQLKGRVSG